MIMYRHGDQVGLARAAYHGDVLLLVGLTGRRRGLAVHSLWGRGRCALMGIPPSPCCPIIHILGFVVTRSHTRSPSI